MLNRPLSIRSELVGEAHDKTILLETSCGVFSASLPVYHPESIAHPHHHFRGKWIAGIQGETIKIDRIISFVRCRKPVPKFPEANP